MSKIINERYYFTKRELQSLDTDMLKKLALEKSVRGNASQKAKQAQEELYRRSGEGFRMSRPDDNNLSDEYIPPEEK